MENRWSDKDARLFRERYEEKWGEAVALRVYTSRLIGAEPALVMHGGGNTSVKDSARRVTGDEVEAIFVKGSGWNLDTIEPEGLPGLDLTYLKGLRPVETLSDEEMVNELRTHLFRAAAPTPSVETLLHAFLPERYVDHSHAEAILSLTNRAHGEALVREALGDRVAIVPYVMPGFGLAKVVAEIYEKAKASGDRIEGLVLMKHGLFTFGPDARKSYERHIGFVTAAEELLEKRSAPSPVSGEGTTPKALRDARAVQLAPLLRKALFDAPGGRHMIVEFRTGEREAEFVDGGDWSREAALAGPMTPDHVIRTKPHPLWLELSDWDDTERFKSSVEKSVSAFAAEYGKYFETYGPARGRDDLARLDGMPRIILVPGCGLFAAGATARDAAVVADLYHQTIRMKTASAGLGPYEGLPDADLFDMEYWSLEQAKLGKKKPAPLAGRVVLLAGGGGPIGLGIGRTLGAEGAVVVSADIDESAARKTAEAVRADGGVCFPVKMDVTEPTSIEAAMDAAVRGYGGIDGVVINAGMAHVQALADMDLSAFRRVAEVNLFGAMHVLKAVSARMIRQGLGGDILLVSSKNVTAPGADFGAYSASKAGAHQLMRIGALELAPHDIRVNAVLPDAVFSEGEVPSGLWKEVGPARAASRGMREEELPEFYRKRNLLKTEVSGMDVGRAVAFFMLRKTPVTGVALPVDGGVAAAFPR